MDELSSRFLYIIQKGLPRLLLLYIQGVFLYIHIQSPLKTIINYSISLSLFSLFSERNYAETYFVCMHSVCIYIKMLLLE